GLVQLADNLSLYLCLNEPGVPKTKEHAFFKSGIPISNEIEGIKTAIVDVHWQDKKRIQLAGLPYVAPFSVTLTQKLIHIKQIEEHGLIKAYETALYDKHDIDIQ